MKVIFLDVDGVLNHVEWFQEEERLNRTKSFKEGGDNLWIWINMVDPSRIKLLDQLVEKTDAKIVMSSTWRLSRTLKEIKDLFNNRLNLKAEIIDKTPHYGCERGHEIGAWLVNSKDKIESFVILDDDSDMVGVMNRLIRTGTQKGLEQSHVDRAIEMLGVKK